MALKLDLYQPDGDRVAERPVLIFVHGGGFWTGNKSDGTDLATAFARRGFVTASIGYRLLATGPCAPMWPAQCTTAATAAQHDTQAAVRWLRAKADFLKIDPDRIAMAGESAGAKATLLVAWRPDDPGASGNSGQPSRIQAAVSIAGGYPSNGYISAGDAPAFFFHGSEDSVVPPSWAESNVSAMLSRGLTAGLRTFEGADHYLSSPFRSTIHEQTSYFLYYLMDLARAER